MSTPLSKSCLPSSLPINKEAKIMEKQGIVTFLQSDCERTKAASLRRTLSADMSSKKWLAENGFSQAMKKIASSEQLLVSLVDSSSSSGEEDCEERTEQLEGKEQKEELEKPGQFDIWSSIVSQKDNQDTPKVLPPPYTHPLAKRSASSLSGKSLEICTESLGSETGSDGFSSDPSSETEDVEEEKGEEEEEEQQQQQEDLKVFSPAFDHREELRVAKYHYASTDQKSKSKSFPPPLPSLSRKDGASLLMQTHRDNGRLVLEAVTVPSQNQFHAERQDGRLVLTFLSSPSSEDAKDEKSVEGDQQQEEEEEEEEEEEKVNNEVFEDKFEDFEEVYDNDEGGQVENEPEGEEVESFDDDENVPKGMEIVIEKEPKLSSRAINVHRLALTVNQPIRMADMMNPSVTKSLPPHRLVARLMPLSPHDAASSTAAEYYWWAKPTANPITQQLPTALQSNGNKPIISKIPMPNEQRQLFVLRRNKGDYYSGPLVKGCKEPRRSPVMGAQLHCHLLIHTYMILLPASALVLAINIIVTLFHQSLFTQLPVFQGLL